MTAARRRRRVVAFVWPAMDERHQYMSALRPWICFMDGTRRRLEIATTDTAEMGGAIACAE